MKIIAIGVFACSLLGSPISPAAEPDTHAQAATELLKLLNVEKQMGQGAAVMADVMIKQNAMLGPYRDVLLKWAASFMTWDALGSQIVALYESAFIESELRELAAFYRTSVGQKTITEMPELARRMMELGGGAAKEHLQELDAMIRARAAELEKVAPNPSN